MSAPTVSQPTQTFTPTPENAGGMLFSSEQDQESQKPLDGHDTTALGHEALIGADAQFDVFSDGGAFDRNSNAPKDKLPPEKILAALGEGYTHAYASLLSSLTGGKRERAPIKTNPSHEAELALASPDHFHTVSGRNEHVISSDELLEIGRLRASKELSTTDAIIGFLEKMSKGNSRIDQVVTLPAEAMNDTQWLKLKQLVQDTNWDAHETGPEQTHGALRFRFDEAASGRLVRALREGQINAPDDPNERREFWDFWSNVELSVTADDILAPSGQLTELINGMIHKAATIKEWRNSTDTWLRELGQQPPTYDLYRKFPPQLRMDAETTSAVASRLSHREELPRAGKDPEEAWSFWSTQFDSLTVTSAEEILQAPTGDYARLILAVQAKGATQDHGTRLSVSENATDELIDRMKAGEALWPTSMQETEEFIRLWPGLSVKIACEQFPVQTIDWEQTVVPTVVGKIDADFSQFNRVGTDLIVARAMWANVEIHVDPDKFTNYFGVELEEDLVATLREYARRGVKHHGVTFVNSEISETQAANRPELRVREPGSANIRARLEDDGSATLVISDTKQYQQKIREDALQRNIPKRQAFIDSVVDGLIRFDGGVEIWVPEDVFYHPENSGARTEDYTELERLITNHNVRAASILLRRVTSSDNNTPEDLETFLPGIPADKIVDVVLKNMNLTPEMRNAGHAQERATAARIRREYIAELLRVPETETVSADTLNAIIFAASLDKRTKDPIIEQATPQTLVTETDPTDTKKEGGKVIDMAEYSARIGAGRLRNGHTPVAKAA